MSAPGQPAAYQGGNMYEQMFPQLAPAFLAKAQQQGAPQSTINSLQGAVDQTQGMRAPAQQQPQPQDAGRLIAALLGHRSAA